MMSATSCDSFGGVDGGVSESLVSSLIIPRFSPLVRGLELVLKWDVICDAISENGAASLLGSQGIGLFGSLESQFGMLLCLCMGMLVEKELRLMPFGSSGADIIEYLVVVV
jgi:hypothetical protein